MLEVDRTYGGHHETDASDPKRTCEDVRFRLPPVPQYGATMPAPLDTDGSVIIVSPAPSLTGWKLQSRPCSEYTLTAG